MNFLQEKAPRDERALNEAAPLENVAPVNEIAPHIKTMTVMTAC